MKIPLLPRLMKSGMMAMILTNQSNFKKVFNHIWSSLVGLLRTPSASETTRSDPNKLLTKPIEFDLDSHITPNT